MEQEAKGGTEGALELVLGLVLVDSTVS